MRPRRTPMTQTKVPEAPKGFPLWSHPPEPKATMPLTKTPTSSLSGSCTTYFSSLHLTTITATAIELLIRRVWYRSLAGIQRIRSGGTVVARVQYSEGAHETLVARRQTSHGSHQNDLRPSRLVCQTQPPGVLTDLLLLVHHRRSSSPPHPDRSTRFPEPGREI